MIDPPPHRRRPEIGPRSAEAIALRRVIMAFDVRSNRAIQTVTAAVLFTLLTVIFTWPVASGVGGSVPSDFGDRC